MFKHTLILTVVIALAAGSSFAEKRGGFSFGGGSSFKGSMSKSIGSSSSNSGSSSSLRRSLGNSIANSNHGGSNQISRINTNSIRHNLHQNFNTQIKKIDHQPTLHHGQIQTRDIKFSNPVLNHQIKKIDPKFNHHDHKKINIHVDLGKHHGHAIKPICPPKVDCHPKPHCGTNVWWGCHKPVHCHTVIKVPCHTTVVKEVVVAEPLAQVMVNTTIQLDTAGLSPEAGQLIIQMDQLSIPGEIVEWSPLQAKVTIPMMNLTGPMKATLHLVNADGSLAQSVNVELIPFNEAALAAITP